MLKNYSGDLAILVDFDGTITTTDTNLKLVKMYGNDNVMKVRQAYRDGKIDYITLFDLQFKEFKLTEEEYTNFILTEFDLTKGFVEFYNNVKKNNIPLAVISGGFDNGIIPFLKKYGIENVDIFSNSLEFSGNNMKAKIHDKEDIIDCFGHGPCGNCKVKHYKEYKRKHGTVIFIGDGTTDQCVAKIADIVFAKDSLLDYCEENKIECIPWKYFDDVNKIIFK
jgi:2-hydroxy-3-keto-5-methylthiopentenyl-1-phosphate phosphatase